MADDDWTFVPRKKQGKTQKVTVHAELRFLKDATLDSITREFEAKTRTWRQSNARKQLHRSLLHLRPEGGWQIRKAVCLGTGSFNRDNFECRRRTMEQFAMFVDTVGHLQEAEEQKIEMIAQEWWYNDLDKEFLESKGIHVSEMQMPSCSDDCGPATKHFGPNTFVCELYIEHSGGTVRCLAQSQNPLLISTSRRMCLRSYSAGDSLKKDDQANLLRAMDKYYRTLRFPHFEADPNVFEGLDVLAPVPEEED